MKKTKQDIIHDICVEYRMSLHRAKSAHKRYLSAIREQATHPEKRYMLDHEIANYNERRQWLGVCRMLKNILTESKEQRFMWGDCLVLVRDRRWNRDTEEKYHDTDTHS